MNDGTTRCAHGKVTTPRPAPGREGYLVDVADCGACESSLFQAIPYQKPAPDAPRELFSREFTERLDRLKQVAREKGATVELVEIVDAVTGQPIDFAKELCELLERDTESTKVDLGDEFVDEAPQPTVAAPGRDAGEQKPEPGKRYDAGKNMLQLIPDYPLWELGRVYTYGAQKYEDENWRKGTSFKRILGCIYRHFLRLKNGHDLDNGPGGSGLPHAALIVFSCFQLLELSVTHPEFDDRVKGAAQVPA